MDTPPLLLLRLAVLTMAPHGKLNFVLGEACVFLEKGWLQYIWRCMEWVKYVKAMICLAYCFRLAQSSMTESPAIRHVS